MPFFPCAHAGHAQWQFATKQVVVQLRAQICMQQLDPSPPLGLVYLSQSYTGNAAAIFAMLADALPDVQHWVGCAAASVLGGDMDYGETGALAVLLPCVAGADYQVFSGVAPLQSGFAPSVASMALVHGEATQTSLETQLSALQAAMPGGKLVGGVSALAHAQAQVVRGDELRSLMPPSIGGGGVQRGGVSGVLFGPSVQMLAVSMQGCKPLGNSLTATHVEGDVLLQLDGRAALDVLLERLSLGPAMASPQADAASIWGRVQQTMVAISPQAMPTAGKCIEPQSRVQPIAGLDPLRRALVLRAPLQQGHAITLCQRDEQAVRADIRRACAEIGEALTSEVAWGGDAGPETQPHGFCIAGAIYVRSQHRQALPRKPQVDAELQLIRHALGPVPLLGFTSACEVEGEVLQHLSAQLIVFLQPLQPLSSL